MLTFYVQYQAVPIPESDAFGECGGAYINCWVKAGSKIKAQEMARKAIEETKWQIILVEEECQEVTEEYYSENVDGIEYYRQATLDGECYVYHQWPNEP